MSESFLIEHDLGIMKGRMRDMHVDSSVGRKNDKLVMIWKYKV